MKNPIPSILACAVAAAMICPKFVANNIESNIYSVIESVNKLPGYSASVTEFNSSWFNTNSRVKINLDTSVFNDQTPEYVIEQFNDFSLEFDINAQHGPILLSGENTIGLAAMTIDLVTKELREAIIWPKDQAFYHVDLYTNFFSEIQFTDSLTPFDIKNVEDELMIKFDGYKGGGTFSDNNWQYIGKSENTVINTNVSRVELGNMDINMNVNASFIDMLQSGFYDSDAKMSLNSITATGEELNSEFSLDNLYIKAVSIIDEESSLGNFEITYGIDAINSQEFNAKDMALVLEINNISKSFVEAYQKNIYDLSIGSEQEVQAKISDFAKTHLLALLKSEPQFNISSLRGTLEQGSFDSAINTSLVGISDMPSNITNQQFWLSHLLANGFIKGDKAVIEFIASKIMLSQLEHNPQVQEMSPEEVNQIALEQTDQVIQTFIQQGLLIENEQGYITNVLFKDKALTINDTPIPLGL